MRRRSRAGSKITKSRRRKRSTPKRRNASKAVRNRAVSIADQQTEVSGLTRELQEGQEQQRATSEILGVIARSRTDVQSVLDTVCRSAAQLCQAYDASVWRTDGDQLLLAPIMVRSLKSSLFRWSAGQSWVVQFSTCGLSTFLISKPRETNFP